MKIRWNVKDLNYKLIRSFKTSSEAKDFCVDNIENYPHNILEIWFELEFCGEKHEIRMFQFYVYKKNTLVVEDLLKSKSKEFRKSFSGIKGMI